MRLSRKAIPKTFLATVGARIQARREYLKIRQVDFAERIGISQPALSRIENGEIDLSICRAAQIVVALETTLANLLEGLI